LKAVVNASERRKGREKETLPNPHKPKASEITSQQEIYRNLFYSSAWGFKRHPQKFKKDVFNAKRFKNYASYMWLRRSQQQ
jgi:hypothetical protein